MTRYNLSLWQAQFQLILAFLGREDLTMNFWIFIFIRFASIDVFCVLFDGFNVLISNKKILKIILIYFQVKIIFKSTLYPNNKHTLMLSCTEILPWICDEGLKAYVA